MTLLKKIWFIKLVDGKFATGVVWNFASFAVMGIIGLIINILIARFYDPWVFGVFNLVFAIYFFASQLAVLGIHQSTLRYVSVIDDPIEVSTAVSVALFLTIVISALLTGLLWFSRFFVANIFDSLPVKTGIENILPGLLLFPLNKVFLAALNGCRRMRAYALGNIARYIFILGGAFWAILSGLPGERLTVIFSIAEGLLFLGMLFVNWHLIRTCRPQKLMFWARKHLIFGVKGISGGLLFELNSRIDILMLGFFVSTSEVGIYSFAVILAEGLRQMLVVFRVNYDPVLARLVNERNWDQLRAIISNGVAGVYRLMAVVGCIAIVFYPWVIRMLTNRPDYERSWLIFIILMAGFVASAGFVPFGGLLQQSGHPGSQSILVGLSSIINILGNLILIPLLGLPGVALATAIAQVAFIFLLKSLVRIAVGERLI